MVICTGRQPFSTLARNQTRTGPAFSISRSLRPGGAGDADAGQRRHLGLVGLGRRVAPDRLHRAERHRRVLRVPPVHHHAAGRAHERRDALLLVPGRMIGELRERDLAGRAPALVLAGRRRRRRRSARPRCRRQASARCGPSVFASIAISTGARRRASRPAPESSRGPASRARAPRRRPWSAPRRCTRPCGVPFSEPARRDGIVRRDVLDVRRGPRPPTPLRRRSPPTCPDAPPRCPLAFGREKTFASQRLRLPFRFRKIR